MSHAFRLVFLLAVFFALQCFIIAKAHAEYRVYKLGITDDPSQPETEVLTTLDDQQYVTYYRLSPTEKVRLIDHWMCLGRTNDFQSYCQRGDFPSKRELAQIPH